MLYLFKRTFLLIYRNKDNSFRFQWLSSLFIKGYKNKSTFANKNERSSVTDKGISISCVSAIRWNLFLISMPRVETSAVCIQFEKRTSVQFTTKFNIK